MELIVEQMKFSKGTWDQ